MVKSSYQIRNMCYVGRLVILHHLYMFGNLTTMGEGDHLGTVEEHHKI